MEFFKKNWHLLLFPVLPIVIMVYMVGSMAWRSYQDSYAHYPVGTCLKVIDIPGNEFRELKYAYKVILAVGKERYQYMRVYRFGDGEWTAYKADDEFHMVDRYDQPVVVDCSEVRIMMGK